MLTRLLGQSLWGEEGDGWGWMGKARGVRGLSHWHRPSCCGRTRFWGLHDRRSSWVGLLEGRASPASLVASRHTRRRRRRCRSCCAIASVWIPGTPWIAHAVPPRWRSAIGWLRRAWNRRRWTHSGEPPKGRIAAAERKWSTRPWADRRRSDGRRRVGAGRGREVGVGARAIGPAADDGRES